MERLRRGDDQWWRSATVIRRYGGTVEFNGDGVMALFGARWLWRDHAYPGLPWLHSTSRTKRAGWPGEVKQNDERVCRRVGANSGR